MPVDVMGVLILADRYGITGFAEKVAEQLRYKLSWGANIALVCHKLQKVPHDSEYRVRILEAMHGKISIYSIEDFRANLDKELAILGDDAPVLPDKLLLLHTVKEAVMREWWPHVRPDGHESIKACCPGLVNPWFNSPTISKLTHTLPGLTRVAVQ